MNLRLQQFINAENITQSELADTIGVARGSISHILSGRNKPSFDLIEKMAVCYPALNIEWLITGKGKMYKNHATVVQEGDLFDFADDENEAPQDDYTIEEAKENMAGMTAIRVKPPKATALNRKLQQVKNQRIISRILVFFDDGTFQELVQDNA
ncbi:MAG: helix-turn-helix transcriptional regulator [Bacteroidales bacterium]|nr:helix-turn-helix transcriptional regulator [Bacteroidales bacterium]